jgi:hypothetical protein
MKAPHRRAPRAMGLLLFALGMLASVPGAEAKARAGIPIEVVRIDGSELSGELIAIRPDAIVVADLNAGLFQFVPLTDVRIVRIPKTSRLAGAWSGFQQGAFYGAVLGDLSTGKELSSAKRRTRAFLGGLAGAAAGSLVGGLLGRTTKKKEVIQIRDQPPAELAAILARLNRRARVREEF